MKRATKISGLNLWKVHLDGELFMHLLITTRQKSIATARSKAMVVAQREGYRGKISKIEHAGELDA